MTRTRTFNTIKVSEQDGTELGFFYTFNTLHHPPKRNESKINCVPDGGMQFNEKEDEDRLAEAVKKLHRLGYCTEVVAHETPVESRKETLAQWLNEAIEMARHLTDEWKDVKLDFVKRVMQDPADAMAWNGSKVMVAQYAAQYAADWLESEITQAGDPVAVHDQMVKMVDRLTHRVMIDHRVEANAGISGIQDNAKMAANIQLIERFGWEVESYNYAVKRADENDAKYGPEL